MTFTFLIVVSFMIRITSPIGFILIYIIKMFREKLILNTIMAAAIIAGPTFCLLIAIDSYFYDQLTIVPYNFYIVNIVNKVSE